MPTADELEARLAQAETRLEALTAQARQNDEKLRSSQQREIQLLQAPDLDCLLYEMTEGLRESFDLQTVSGVLRDPGHDIRHLLVAMDVDRNPDLILVEALIARADVALYAAKVAARDRVAVEAA